MKKYIKPEIEELNLGATLPILTSGEIYVDTSGTVIDPTGGDDGGDGGYGMWAPSRKGSTDDEDFGW